MSSLLTILSAVLLQAASSDADGQNNADAENIQFARWQKYYRNVAAEYEMEIGEDPITKLNLHPNPIFSYSNPAGGNKTHGAMFVWTLDGRPEIFGAIWSQQREDKRKIVHSLHSLSLQPLQATRNGKVFWAPRDPGIEPFLIPGAPEPAATAPIRLAQMRELARDFSATTIRDTTVCQLVLQPRPAFRWETPTVDRDGAVFVWFENWDPEVLMLIEIRKTQQGPRWHASFGRFTQLPVSAKHKDAMVWSFAESLSESAFGGFDKRYNSVHGVDILPAVRSE